MLKTIIINWIINFAISKLFGNKPDTSNSQIDGAGTDTQAETMRLWLLEKSGSFKLIADKTNITLDDKVLAWLTKVLNDAALFSVLYNAVNGFVETTTAVADEPANAGLIRRLRRRHWITEEQAANIVNENEAILKAIQTIRNA